MTINESAIETLRSNLAKLRPDSDDEYYRMGA